MKIALLFVYLVLIAEGFVKQKKLSKNEMQDPGLFTGYRLINDWVKMPSSLPLGNPVGISIDRDQNIIILQRGRREWPYLSTMPRSFIKDVAIDKEQNIYIGDIRVNSIQKFEKIFLPVRKQAVKTWHSKVIYGR